MSQRLTPPQTVGPFFEPSLLREDARRNVLVGPSTIGERIRIEGRVMDGNGEVVPDALVEIWQANHAGRYNHPRDTRALPLDPAFSGFGRSGTDDEGRFWFETVKPGRVPMPDGRAQAPHLNLVIFARGLLDLLATRLYFEGDPANEDDPLLCLLPPERRGTLIARRTEQPGQVGYSLDLVLQGAAETVFLRY